MTDWLTIVMETVVEEHPRTEVYPSTDSGVIRLSPHGLWDGIGIYTSAVIDMEEIVTLSGIFWDSTEDYQTSVDSSTGLPKTLELRYHDYDAPELNEAGGFWADGDYPAASDPTWGDSGLEWNEWENGYAVSGINVRYIQWRATLRGA